METFSLRKGDVLVCEGGEPGRAAVWKGEDSDILFQKALHRIRPKSGISPDILVYYLMYLARSGQLEAHFTGSTIKHLPQVRLQAIPFPIIPRNVQLLIVNCLDGIFMRADHLKAEAIRTSALLDRLKDSILSKAFRGDLVPQDPADESASVLLERIRLERAAKPIIKPNRLPTAQAEFRT